MSNQHKHPTISFRISDAERKQIETRILASGMMKKDYFVRSCIYNRICVVGKKETIWAGIFIIPASPDLKIQFFLETQSPDLYMPVAFLNILSDFQPTDIRCSPVHRC